MVEQLNAIPLSGRNVTKDRLMTRKLSISFQIWIDRKIELMSIFRVLLITSVDNYKNVVLLSTTVNVCVS